MVCLKKMTRIILNTITFFSRIEGPYGIYLEIITAE